MLNLVATVEKVFEQSFLDLLDKYRLSRRLFASTKSKINRRDIRYHVDEMI